MQHTTNITNLSDIIPTVESIPCPDCGNRVTISPHPNSHFIAGMDDVFIMANAGTLHAKIVLKRRRYSSSVLHVWPPILIDLLTVQHTVCKKVSRLPPNTQNHNNI